MGGVDVAEDVCFKGGVHGYHAEAAYDFRAVGYFCGTKHYLVAEKVDV